MRPNSIAARRTGALFWGPSNGFGAIIMSALASKQKKIIPEDTFNTLHVAKTLEARPCLEPPLHQALYCVSYRCFKSWHTFGACPMHFTHLSALGRAACVVPHKACGLGYATRHASSNKHANTLGPTGEACATRFGLREGRASSLWGFARHGVSLPPPISFCGSKPLALQPGPAAPARPAPARQIRIPARPKASAYPVHRNSPCAPGV